MLFMGSGRYPAENDYDDYLTRHGGAANAFTDLVGSAACGDGLEGAGQEPAGMGGGRWWVGGRVG